MPLHVSCLSLTLKWSVLRAKTCHHKQCSVYNNRMVFMLIESNFCCIIVTYQMKQDVILKN